MTNPILSCLLRINSNRMIRNKAHQGWWKLLETAYRGYVGLSMSALSRIEFGENVYDKEWDVLIVLDTARVDAMKKVSDGFNFIDHVDSIRSVGSTSSEWIAHTFSERNIEQINETVLVSANPHVQHTIFDRQFPEDDKGAYFAWTDWNTVHADEFQLIDQPWQYATDDRYNHVLPYDVTQRAVKLHREESPERMIIHYMPPHRPHISQAISEGRELRPEEKDPFTYLKNGGDRERVFSNHVSDLRYVLKEGVEPLLNNIDADKVVITADHGDGFGEQYCYAHIAGDPRSPVRRVPWVTTSAEDTGEMKPSLEPPSDVTSETASQLEALGYH